MFEAKGPCSLRLGRVGRRRNRLACALGAGQLGDGIPDRPADRRSQNGLARLEARLREGNLRRQIGDRKTSRGDVIDPVRDGTKIFGARGEPLGVGSVLRDTVGTGEHDPRAHWKRRAAWIFHDARSLVPQYQRGRRSWVAAREYGVVQRADAGGCDPDEDSPVGTSRSRHLHQLQASVPGERLGADGSHRPDIAVCIGAP